MAGLAAYANGFQSAFVFDGTEFVQQNPVIYRLWPPDYLWFGTRPLVYFTFALNYALSGRQPWSYFAGNLAIHLAVALALYGVVRRTLLLPRLRERFAAAATPLAFAAALVWMVHPLQTQSVTYLYQRLESLASLMLLLSLYCFVRSLTGNRFRWQVASVAACAAGMACKELVAVAPLLILWYDRAFVASSWRELVQARCRYHVALWGTLGVLAVLMVTHAAGYEVGGIGIVKGVSAWEYARSQPGVILHYVRLWFAPSGQCLDYDWPVAQSFVEIIPPAIVIGLLLAAAAWGIWRQPQLAFLGGWFFLLLAPTSTIVPIRDLAFEHRVYLASAALAVLSVLVLAAATRYVQRRVAEASAALPALFWGGVVAAAVALGLLTIARNRVYRSETVMWNDVLNKVPTNARAHVNLSGIYLEQRNYELALRHAQTAVELKPDEAAAHNNLGQALMHLGRNEQALPALHESIRLNPQFSGGYLSLGNFYRSSDPPQALDLFRRAVELDPLSSDAHNNLGIMLWRVRQDPVAARREYELALQLHPGNSQAHLNLGTLSALQGDAKQAVFHLENALRIQPENAEARHNLQVVLQSLRKS